MNEDTRMTIQGSYRRQSDDSHFTYTAKVHQEYLAFSAKVFDSYGDLVGTPLIFLSEMAGDPENQCRAWIETCIRDRVGVR